MPDIQPIKDFFTNAFTGALTPAQQHQIALDSARNASDAAFVENYAAANPTVGTYGQASADVLRSVTAPLSETVSTLEHSFTTVGNTVVDKASDVSKAIVSEIESAFQKGAEGFGKGLGGTIAPAAAGVGIAGISSLVFIGGLAIAAYVVLKLAEEI